jgi:hypothetical protein
MTLSANSLRDRALFSGFAGEEGLSYFPKLRSCVQPELRTMRRKLRTPLLCFFCALQNDASIFLCVELRHSRFPRHPHIGIDRRTKRRESAAPEYCSLRTCVPGQYSSCYASSRDTVCQVRLGAQAFDTAFGPGVYSTNQGKVFGGRVRSRTHVLEAATELFPHG